MELREYLAALRKRWLTVLVVTILALAAAAALTFSTPARYQSTTRLFFSVQDGQSVSDLAQASSFTERQMSSYARVATSPLVLEPVIRRLDLDIEAEELEKSVVAAVPPNTVILEITVTREDPEDAARIANLVGAQLASTVGRLSPERPDGSQAVIATTLNRARPAEQPSSPDPVVNFGVGLGLGLVLGVGTAVLREVLDTRVRSEQDLAAVTPRPVLGAITFDPAAPRNPLVMQDDPGGQRAESIRRLRTNLQYVKVARGLRSIVVTSSLPDEGKSTITVNLALALADAGSRVIVVDADFRRPSVAELMGVEGAVGLTTVLIGNAELDDAIQSWGAGRIDVLAAGEVPPNPSELLGSPGMAVLLEQLSSRYDVVLLDAAPLLPVTDAAVLAKFAHGTLIVVDAGRIHRAEVVAALSSLAAVDAHVLGLVLNKVPKRAGRRHGYGYGYEAAAGRRPTSGSESGNGRPQRTRDDGRRRE